MESLTVCCEKSNSRTRKSDEMDIVSPEIERLIWWWAWNTTHKCGMDASDVAQELWTVAILKSKEWDPDKNAALTSYLYRALEWRCLELVRDYVREVEAKAKYATEVKDQVVDFQEERLSVVAKRARDKLNNQRKRFDTNIIEVFDLMLNPPMDLHARAQEYHQQQQVDLSEESVTTVKDAHVAYFLGVSAMTVSRALKKIRKVLETEVNVDQKKENASS